MAFWRHYFCIFKTLFHVHTTSPSWTLYSLCTRCTGPLSCKKPPYPTPHPFCIDQFVNAGYDRSLSTYNPQLPHAYSCFTFHRKPYEYITPPPIFCLQIIPMIRSPGTALGYDLGQCFRRSFYCLHKLTLTLKLQGSPSTWALSSDNRFGCPR